MPKSLNKLVKLRKALVWLKRSYLRRVWGLDIHPTVEMSLSAKFDLTHPRGVHVGAHSYVAFGARILSHDMTRRLKTDTWVGENCFIGGQSMVLPGVRIGNGCIVGAGAVVTKSVPDNCIVAGNPAQIIHRDVKTVRYGTLDPDWLRARAAEKAAERDALQAEQGPATAGAPEGFGTSNLGSGRQAAE